MTVYLDYAGTGLVRERARAAMRSAIDDALPYGAEGISMLLPYVRRAREAAARLLDCHADEIALIPNTSSGVHLVADGLEWRAGEEIVLFEGDFPANVRPWQRLAERGVRLRWVPMRDGQYDLEDVATAITPRTRLIACSHVNFATGFRLDLDAVCSLAAGTGSLVFVDAVQSAGVLPVSMARTPVDFLAAGGHKWLCGPPGTGLFFCRRNRLDLLGRAPNGWWGYEGAGAAVTAAHGYGYNLPLRPSARRFEPGMYNLPGVAGLAEALAEIEEIGPAAITERVRSLTARLCPIILDRGFTSTLSNSAAQSSGIVSFSSRNWTSSQVVELLARKRIIASDPAGRIRLSPHFWTEDAEVTAFSEAISQIL